MTAEPAKWHCATRLEKYLGNWSADEILAGLAGDPFEVIEKEGNILLNAGVLAMFKALRGDVPVYFSAANSRIGVGSGTAAVSATQTDLQATMEAGTLVNVTGASNATPIVITTAGHGFLAGDTVTVTGVLGNTAANGTWIVAAPTATTFELVGSVGNGAYTSGGTAQRGNRMRVAMDSGWPKVGTVDGIADNQIQFRSTFGAAVANYAWNEWGVFNASSGGTMLNRSITGQGTKASPATWTLIITITIS